MKKLNDLSIAAVITIYLFVTIVIGGIVSISCYVFSNRFDGVTEAQRKLCGKYTAHKP